MHGQDWGRSSEMTDWRGARPERPVGGLHDPASRQTFHGGMQQWRGERPQRPDFPRRQHGQQQRPPWSPHGVMAQAYGAAFPGQPMPATRQDFRTQMAPVQLGAMPPDILSRMTQRWDRLPGDNPMPGTFGDYRTGMMDARRGPLGGLFGSGGGGAGGIQQILQLLQQLLGNRGGM